MQAPPSVILRPLFWILLILFIPTAVGITLATLSLNTPAAPLGIVSFEFCGFTGDCEAMLAQWAGRPRDDLIFSLGLDYLFLVTYAGLICVSLLRLAAPLAPARRRLVALIAYGALAAGAADAIENYALLQIAYTGSAGGYGYWAGVFASIKFALVMLSLLTLLGLALQRLFARNQRR